MEVALRGDEVELALAGLRQDVLEALTSGRLGEVAGLGLGAVAHLSLPEVLPLDADGAEGDAEGLALTGEGLREADEAGGKDAAANLVCQRFGKGVGFFSHGKGIGCVRRTPGLPGKTSRISRVANRGHAGKGKLWYTIRIIERIF